MTTIYDKDFKYTPACATNIRDRLIANGMVPTKPMTTELDRLRKFKREIEALAVFANHKVIFSDHVFEELLSDCDGGTMTIDIKAIDAWEHWWNTKPEPHIPAPKHCAMNQDKMIAVWLSAWDAATRQYEGGNNGR